MWRNSSKPKRRLKRLRPSLVEIDAVLRNELSPHFADLERLRRNTVFTLTVTVTTVGALVALIALSSSPAAAALRSSEHSFGILVGGGITIGAFFFHRARKRYSGEFKEKVMRKVAARFFPDLRYQPHHHIAKSLYDESKLFRESLDTYTGNDHFSGKLGEVDFQFSELLCQYTSGSGKNRRTHTVFRGFFFVGDFHRNFYFRTTVRPDVAEKLLGVLGRGLQRMGSGSRLVDLEDPEFEEMFVAESDDQVEARYILTPIFMEKLKDFRRRVGNDIHLCFVNGKMILAIETHHDYFEPNIFGEILSRKDLMKFIDMLSLLIGVADEFLHHPKFSANPPAMPHPPLPPKATPPPLTAANRVWLLKK